MNIHWKYTTRIKWTSCLSRIPLLQLYQIFFLKPVCYQGFWRCLGSSFELNSANKERHFDWNHPASTDVLHLYPWMACPWQLCSLWNSHHSHRFANIIWCKSGTLEQRRFWFHCVTYCVEIYFQTNQCRSALVLQVRPDQVRVVECKVLTTNDVAGAWFQKQFGGHRGNVGGPN